VISKIKAFRTAQILSVKVSASENGTYLAMEHCEYKQEALSVQKPQNSHISQ